MTIAREAWLLLVAASAAAWVAYLLCGFYCATPLIVIALLIPYLFRDPECRVPPVPLAVVSPVNGRVVSIEQAEDPYLGREAVKIIVHMPVLGPFVMRGPIEGRIMQQWYLPEGLDPHLLANVNPGVLRDDPDAHQGRYAMWLQTDEQDDVVMVLRGALISRRLRCSVQVGERIGQGQRCGLVQFAAVADVYVPSNCRIEVTQGDAVRAGSAIIATLVHKSTLSAATVAGTHAYE